MVPVKFNGIENITTDRGIKKKHVLKHVLIIEPEHVCNRTRVIHLNFY